MNYIFNQPQQRRGAHYDQRQSRPRRDSRAAVDISAARSATTAHVVCSAHHAPGEPLSHKRACHYVGNRGAAAYGARRNVLQPLRPGRHHGMVRGRTSAYRAEKYVKRRTVAINAKRDPGEWCARCLLHVGRRGIIPTNGAHMADYFAGLTKGVYYRGKWREHRWHVPEER